MRSPKHEVSSVQSTPWHPVPGGSTATAHNTAIAPTQKQRRTKTAQNCLKTAIFVQVAIFKPCDEEPLAMNNPKGYVGRAMGEPGWKVWPRSA